MSAEIINNLRNFLLFIFKVYLKYWFTAPNASSAPRNDLSLLKSINKYSSENIEVSTFMVMDDEVNNKDKLKIATNLINKKSSTNEKRITYSNNILKMQLHDFISIE